MSFYSKTNYIIGVGLKKLAHTPVPKLHPSYPRAIMSVRAVPRIAVWHHEACHVMTNGDPEGRIYLGTIKFMPVM